MHYTQNSGYDTIVKRGIFENPRVIYAFDDTCQTWLHKYAALGECGCLRIILETHAKNESPSIPGCPSYVDCRDEKRRTALHYAAMSGLPDCVDLLLKSGANPDVPDHEGKRPCDVIGLQLNTGPYGYPVNIEACERLLPRNGHA